MDARPAGHARLTVTPVGLGLAALGRPGYLNVGHGDDLGADRSVEVMRAHAHEILDVAYEAGVRYFDVARSYGRAEEFLATWLQDRALSPGVTVASKWGYTYTADWQIDAETHEVKDHSPEAFDRQLAETQQILGDHLSLYQIHSATLETGVLTDPRVLERLIALADDGVQVGLTVSGTQQSEAIRQALVADVDGRNPFSAVQATWNLLEPSAGAALQEAHDAGWVVIVKEGLANGRLTARNDDPAFLPKLRSLQAVGGRQRVSADAVALAAVLAQPFTDVALSGAATAPHLTSNLGAIEVDLSVADLDALADLAEDPAAYWGHRASLPWR